MPIDSALRQLNTFHDITHSFDKMYVIIFLSSPRSWTVSYFAVFRLKFCMHFSTVLQISTSHRQNVQTKHWYAYCFKIWNQSWQSTRCYNPQDSHHRIHRSINLKSYIRNQTPPMSITNRLHLQPKTCAKPTDARPVQQALRYTQLLPPDCNTERGTRDARIATTITACSSAVIKYRSTFL
jgi:hypothetical protein